MFTLKHLSLLFVIIVSTEVYAQFDTVVFSKEGYFSYESIVYMGDQNNDGYDDFVLSIRPDPSLREANAMFFRGGNPISSEPVFSIPASYPRAVTATDWNRDGYRDIVIATDARPAPVIVNIYYGGPAIDTISDYTFHFNFADSSNNFLLFKGQNWPIDFDGDGWEELVGANSQTPTNGGSIIFFETGSTGTLPTYHMLSDSNMHPDFLGNYSSVFQQFADIDGDGCTDISMEYRPMNIPNTEFRKFYYGNPSFAFTDTFKIYDTTHIISIPDMNGDSKGELITLNYGSPFPYWYTIVMSFGTKPPNLSTDAGLNLQNSSYTYITSPGDVNHDGFNDLIVHVSYYLARLFLGGNPIPTEKADEYSFSFDNSPNFSGRIGDVTGDGADDICIMENAYYDSDYPMGNTFIIKGTRKPTSIESEYSTNLTSEVGVFASPNPFNKNIKINYIQPSDGVIRIEVFDIMGKEIYSKSAFGARGEHSEDLDFSSFDVSSGTYLIRVSSEEQKGVKTKTVKVVYIK